MHVNYIKLRQLFRDKLRELGVEDGFLNSAVQLLIEQVKESEKA